MILLKVETAHISVKPKFITGTFKLLLSFSICGQYSQKSLTRSKLVILKCISKFLAWLFLKKTLRYHHSPVVMGVAVIMQKLLHLRNNFSLPVNYR